MTDRISEYLNRVPGAYQADDGRRYWTREQVAEAVKECGTPAPQAHVVGTTDLNEVYVIPRDLTDEEWAEIKYNVDRKADPDIPLWRIQEVIRYANFIAGSRGLDIVHAALASAEVEG